MPSIHVVGYHSAEAFVAELRRLAAGAGDRATLEVIGETVEGRDIHAVTITDRSPDRAKPQVLVLACIHGCEVISSELALSLLADATAPSPGAEMAAVLDGADLTIVPCLNVDSRTASLGSLDRRGPLVGAPRRNANRVDLNRNWPLPEGVHDHWSPLAGTSIRWLPWYRGRRPLSEPEAAALAALAERLGPTVVLNLHSTGNIVTYPWGSREEAPADEAGFGAMVAAFQAAQVHTTYRAKQSRTWYPIIGSSNDWFYDRFGALAVTVETSPPAGSVKADWRKAGRFFWYANPTDPEHWIANDHPACLAAIRAGLEYRAGR